MQIQVNVLLLLLDQQHPVASIRDHFQRLICEGVQAVGIETMEGIKSRIQEGIIQQEMDQVRMGRKISDHWCAKWSAE